MLRRSGQHRMWPMYPSGLCLELQHMCPMKSKFKLSTIMVLGLNLKWRLDTLEKTVSAFCRNTFLFGIRSELWKIEKDKADWEV